MKLRSLRGAKRGGLFPVSHAATLLSDPSDGKGKCGLSMESDVAVSTNLKSGPTRVFGVGVGVSY